MCNCNKVEALNGGAEIGCHNAALNKHADKKPKKKIEITEVENGFQVTLTNEHHWDPKIFIAPNLQAASEIVLEHGRK